MTQTLPIGKLQPNPFQPRGKIKDHELEELAQSIESYGIIEPIVVADTPAGYQIIAGERRWRAAQKVKLDVVPVSIKKTSPKGMLEMALVENVQRRDLNPLERAQAFRQLMRNFDYSNAELAKRIGKSPSYISNSLRLLDLPDAIADGLISGQISEGHARALSGITTEQQMVQAYKIILKEDASVRRAEELARQFKKKGQSTNKKSSAGKNQDEVDQAQLKKWESRFQNFFHTQSKLKLSRSARQTKLTITLKGSPEETESDLEKIIDLAEKD